MSHPIPRLITACIVAGALVGGVAPGRALADWTPLTTSSIDTAGTDPGSVAATDVAGTPYVAWFASPASAGAPEPAYVDAIVAGTPTPVGSPIGASDSCRFPSLTAIGSTPYLACTDDTDAIQVYDWNGSIWASAGPAVDTAYPGTSVSITDDGGEPAIAYLGESGGNPDAGGTVKRLSGGSWVTVGTAASLHSLQAHTFVDAPRITMDGTTPVVAWQEDNGSGVNDTEAAYAAQFSGGTWTLTNGGAPIAQAATADALDDLQTIDGTVYAATETADSYDADVGVLALAGQTFTQVGGDVLDGLDTADLPALGSAGGTPIVAAGYGSSSGTGFDLVAQQLTGGTWSALGSPLGIPPVASTGDGYPDVALTSDAAGNPYAVFTEEAPNASGQPQNQVTNVYVEEDTPGGVNPNAPAGPTATQYPPSVSGAAPAPITRAAGPVASAAVLARVDAATLARRGRRLVVHTGLRVSCPAGAARCTARVTARLTRHGHRPIVLRRTVRLAAGRSVTLTLTLTLPQRLKGRVRGSVEVVVFGPNGQAVTFTQRLGG